MQHPRVAVYEVKPGTADTIIERAQAGMLPAFRSHAGFVAYGVLKAHENRVVSLSFWETEAEAEEAIPVAREWVAANIADMVVSVENHVGDLEFFSVAQPVGA
jgi:hypothetical protein